MRPFDEVSGAELRWVKPKRTKLEFELRAGAADSETVLATLAWTRGSQAVGQWAEGAYQFSRAGWLRPRILVRRAESNVPTAADTPEEPIATLAQHGGTLTFADGRTFLWKKPKGRSNEHIWLDSAGIELVRFRPGGRRSPDTATPHFDVTTLPELPLLILLGQYLLMLAQQDAETAMIATTTAAVVASS